MSKFQQLQALYKLPIYSLPPELILDILSMLSAVEFSSFTFAAYHLMRCHGIAPAFSTERIVALLSPSPSEQVMASGGLLRNLPTELILDLIQQLDITDTINFLFANYQLLRDRYIAPWPLRGGSAQICRAWPQRRSKPVANQNQSERVCWAHHQHEPT